MKAWYIAACGVLLAGLGGLAWYKRAYFKTKYAATWPKVRGSARSVWGRTHDAAKKMAHTETVPQPEAVPQSPF